MATVKVFDCNGVKELNCFDTLDCVNYIMPEELSEDEENDDIVDF